MKPANSFAKRLGIARRLLRNLVGRREAYNASDAAVSDGGNCFGERLAAAWHRVQIHRTSYGQRDPAQYLALRRQGNRGLVPRYLPEEAREGATNLCVHRLHRAPKRPERMFMQFHGGVYRSDDAGASWSDIGAGLPSDFGFPMVLDPADPDSAYVIPLASDEDRVTPDGRVQVYETRDAGASWAERGDGLPREGAYLTVLRHALDQAGKGSALELYFGATSGDVFGSGDAGASWFNAATRLPPVYSVSAVR